MLKSLLGAAVLALGSSGPVVVQERIRISSDWGEVTVELADNAAAQSLVGMLPLTIEMRDHLRQEKTGQLPSALPIFRGSRISLSACWDFGVPAISLSTTEAAASRYRVSSSSGTSRAMSRFLIAPVPSPSELSALTERRSAQRIGGSR
jgi:hypothetical protein